MRIYKIFYCFILINPFNLKTNNGYFCTCPFGFEGVNCEVVQDFCSGYCLNGGKCSSLDSDQSKYCECPCDYTGPRCEKKIKFCENSGCFKGSTCLEQDCGFTCGNYK
jgi:hypothetical protein